MTADPRAANCRAFAKDAAGLITGVALDYVEQSASRYALYSVALIDEPTNGVGGPTVATCTVLDANGIQVAERVYLAWPWPDLQQRALPGNPNGQHFISNKFFPPNKGPLALYVGDASGNVLSDVIGGLGLPEGHHVSYRVTWRERVSTPEPPPVEPPPGDDLAAGLAALQADVQALRSDVRQLALHLGLVLP